MLGLVRVGGVGRVKFSFRICKVGEVGASSSRDADVGITANGEGGSRQHEIGERFGNPDEALGDVSAGRSCGEVPDYIIAGGPT